MTSKKFNVRHGLSVGSPAIDVIDSSGLISGGSIPNLDAAKITSGTIDAARLPNILSELTNSNVTSALGYTPYDNSNPAGYITIDEVPTSGGSTPPGTIIVRRGTIPPDGYLLVNGSTISATTYASLAPYVTNITQLNGTPTAVSNSVISASASSDIGDGRNAAAAFDGIVNQSEYGCWHSNYTYGSTSWLQAYFTDGPKTIVGYRIYGRGGGYDIRGWQLYGSNDGSNYTLIDDKSSQSAIPTNSYLDFEVTSPGSYSYYKMITTNTDDAYVVVGEWVLYTSASFSTVLQLPNKNDAFYVNSDYNQFIKY
jgi:hypothetical protein